MINNKTLSINPCNCLPVFLLSALVPLYAQSSEWVVTPGVTLEQIYTDNADLTSDDQQEESITRVKPRISVYREGARAKLDLSYAPQYRHYWEGTRSNEVVHFLKAKGDLELIEDHFSVDAWATADQHTLNSGGRTGIDSATGTSELTEVYTAGISPYLKGELGRYANLEARYGLNRVEYSDEDRDSSTGQRADLVFGSSRSVNVLPWELHLDQSTINYDNVDEDDRITRVKAEVAYKLNRQWALATALGYEKYELALNDDVDGDTWSVGFIYTPSQRTRLAAGFGERSFGNDYYLNLSHRAKRVVWTANYQRDFVTARDEVMRPSLFEREDAFGNLIRDPVLTNPVQATRSGPTLTEGYYLLDSFSTSLVYSTARSSLALIAGYTERDYDNSLQTDQLHSDTRDINASLRYNRMISSRLNGSLSLSWQDHAEDVADGLLDYVQWIIRIGGGYRIGERTSMNLNLSHLKRDADYDALGYSENRVSLNWDMKW